MSENYHSPIEWWLNLPVVELFDWVMVANAIVEERKAKQNVQTVGPGL